MGYRPPAKPVEKKFQKHNLERHMKVHMRAEGQSDAYYHCDKCEKRYASPANLTHHIRSVHDKIDYTCAECPMTFKNLHDMKNHKNLSHSTDERFNCKHCGKRYGNTGTARSHERSHENPQFQCRFCSKLFKTKPHLLAHERFHMGEKPFVCKVCSNGYTSKPGLLQHQQFVHKMVGPKGGGYWCRKQMEKEDPS